MVKENISEQLSLVIRDAEIMSERLGRADLNISDEKKITNLLKKARKLMSEANSLM